MKTKLQQLFATLLLTLGLLLPAAAQQYEQVKPKPHYQIKTPLKCELYYPTPARLDLRNPQVVPASFSRLSPSLAPASDSSGSVTVIVTNTSGGKLKAGEMIYYKTDSQPTQAHKLTADWAAGKLLSFYYQPGNQNCTAWYLK